MKCINHPERDAVASCKICGKSLCPECANRFGQIPYCLPCVKSSYIVQRNELHQTISKCKKIGVALVIACIISSIFILLFMGPDFLFDELSIINSKPLYIIACIFSYIIALYLAFCIPFGWSALNKLTANIFLILPILGWIFYFMFKILLAFYIAPFACPITVLSKKKKIKKLDSIIEQLK